MTQVVATNSTTSRGAVLMAQPWTSDGPPAWEPGSGTTIADLRHVPKAATNRLSFDFFVEARAQEKQGGVMLFWLEMNDRRVPGSDRQAALRPTGGGRIEIIDLNFNRQEKLRLKVKAIYLQDGNPTTGAQVAHAHIILNELEQSQSPTTKSLHLNEVIRRAYTK